MALLPAGFDRLREALAAETVTRLEAFREAVARRHRRDAERVDRYLTEVAEDLRRRMGKRDTPGLQARLEALPAERRRRTFAEDLLRCPRCLTGSLLIIAFITDLAVVEKILTHLGLPTDLPAPAPARHPAQLAWDGDPWDGSGHPHDRQPHARRAARAPPFADPTA